MRKADHNVASTDRCPLWVVEIRFAEDDCGWQPTTGAALSRGDARNVMAEWQTRNPDDRFRVREYRPFP